MKTITIHYTTPYIGTIAKQGEHNQTELVFFLPDNFDDADFVNAEFVKRDGSTSVVDQLIPNNGMVTVPLTQDLTNVDGKMEIQLVAYKVDGTEITEIAKSGIFTCKIRKSLNVLYGEDQPGVIERILAFISYWAEKLPEMWAKKHWHDNKELLDTITPEVLEGEQADWNENDETRKSFVKNRTHWLDDNNEYHPLSNNYLSSEANDAIDQRHTHNNKTVLDNFSTSTAYPFTFLEYAGHTVPQFPINDVAPTTEGGNDYYLNWINPNVWYRFGSADSPVTSISIYQLQSVDSSVAEEYVVEFWTGATAPSPVIFPSDVEWPDGSEPTWAANKHYQVSIVGNMGLYAETDFGEEE